VEALAGFTGAWALSRGTSAAFRYGPVPSSCLPLFAPDTQAYRRLEKGAEPERGFLTSRLAEREENLEFPRPGLNGCAC